MTIKAQLDTRPLTEGLARLQAAVTDFRPVMRDIAGVLADSVEENFAREGRPVWAPLSPVTVAKRGGDAHPILQQSGQLAASIVTEHDSTSATVGTNKIYARVMQEGARKGEFGKYSLLLKDGKQKDTFKRSPVVSMPWGDIPARPFLSITDQEIADIGELIDDYFRREAG